MTMRHYFICLLAGLLLGQTSNATAQAYVLPTVGEDLIGQIKVVRARNQDTLSDIARTYDVGFDEIVHANPTVDHWLPGAGTGVIIPTWHILPNTPRTGLVLNLPEMRLYYYPPAPAGTPAEVITYPVGIGRMDWTTPLGLTRVNAKLAAPAWYPPASIRAEHAAKGEILPKVIAPGPDNPLGAYALQLAIPGYFIHGTDKPYGVGLRVSHGCVHLYPEDISQLFREVPVGTPVRIINQQYKAGWYHGVLYFESYPALAEDRTTAQRDLTPAVRVILAATRQRHARVDWHQVTRAAVAARGIPVAISE
ncbi:MAG: L,D-transpeptidase family protein [Sulfuricaulis sp.]